MPYPCSSIERITPPSLRRWLLETTRRTIIQLRGLLINAQLDLFSAAVFDTEDFAQIDQRVRNLQYVMGKLERQLADLESED